MLRSCVQPAWLLASALLLTSAALAADVPPRSESGQVLVVPSEQLDAGEVYHVTPATGTQLTWTADAPLLRVIATCDRVVGYLVTPFDLEEGQAPLLAGVWRVPVASLTTGNETYDTELHGPAALNAAEYPELTFLITAVSDVELVGTENGRQSYTLEIAGDLTVKETTVRLEFPARMTMVPFTWGTMRFNLGDFIVLRAAFDVKLAEVGLDPPPGAGPDLRSDTARLDLYLLCSTVSPDKNIDPSIKHEHHRKRLRFLTLLRDFNDAEKAYEFGRTFMREVWDDAPALNRLAWATLTEHGIKTRDLGFAFKAAQRANELTEFKTPELLNTLARAHFEKADLEAALNWVRQAAEHLEDASPEIASAVRAALERYEKRAAASD